MQVIFFWCYFRYDFIQFSFSSTLLHIVNSYRTVGKFTMIARCKCYSHIAVWCWLLIRIGHWDNVTYNNFYCHLISSFIWISHNSWNIINTWCVAIW